MTSVSIIIPTLNEANHLPKLLSDLQNQTHKPTEIIIVDGYSTDLTKYIAKKTNGVIFQQIPKNPADQRTLGGKIAKSELLFFLDADVRLNNYFIEQAVDQFKKRNYAIACPFYYPYQSSLFITAFYIYINFLFFSFQKIASSGAGSCIIVKKGLFNKLKGFNNQYIYDDIFFIRQAAQKAKFGMLNLKILVSDRRFKKYGTIQTIGLYLCLSILFVTNQFKLANSIPYPFEY